ncbi:MAG: hypothetical protein LBT21_05970 [Oscillospiraceae bacterium]|jgi:hypothetical protein|nr:hypothetical protein [Oscillospiraceae bacterium]
MRKIFVLLILLLIPAVLAACGEDKPAAAPEETSATGAVTTLPETDPSTEPQTSELTAAPTSDITSQHTSAEQTQPRTAAPTVTSAPAASVTQAASITSTAAPKLPSTKAEILAKYSAVMDKAKAEKIAFKKVQYQEVPQDKREASGAVTGILGSFIDQLFTGKAKAEKNPAIGAKGGDMNDFPVVNAAKGCYLTDVGLIKSASAKKLANGNTQLKITLKDEKNAQPYWSAKKGDSVGGVFDLARKEDFDETLASLPINDPYYDITYYDCTAVLEYDARGAFVRLEQTTYGLADAGFKTLLFGTPNTLKFVVVDITIITTQ